MRWIDRKIDDLIRYYRSRDLNPLRVGPPNDPTYYRYFVIPRNRWLNIYLHDFRHDDVENLHDHRMFNISVPLQGDYFEERFVWRPVEGYPLPVTWLRQQRGIKIRRPSTPHRVILRRDLDGNKLPMWSLFIGFPHVREWGFWTNEGLGHTAKWIPFSEYVDNPDPLSPGYGQRKTR